MAGQQRSKRHSRPDRVSGAEGFPLFSLVASFLLQAVAAGWGRRRRPVAFEHIAHPLHDRRIANDDPDFPSRIELERTKTLAAEESVPAVADDAPGMRGKALQFLRAQWVR